MTIEALTQIGDLNPGGTVPVGTALILDRSQKATKGLWVAGEDTVYHLTVRSGVYSATILKAHAINHEPDFAGRIRWVPGSSGYSLQTRKITLADVLDPRNLDWNPQ